jgi:hypothetical protein
LVGMLVCDTQTIRIGAIGASVRFCALHWPDDPNGPYAPQHPQSLLSASICRGRLGLGERDLNLDVAPDERVIGKIARIAGVPKASRNRRESMTVVDGAGIEQVTVSSRRCGRLICTDNNLGDPGYAEQ